MEGGEKIMRNKNFNKGFTLVELLVVITVIGLLAAALLVGINPLEQMRKARDSGRVSKAKEAISAAERVYTFTGACVSDISELQTTYDELKDGNYSGVSVVSCDPFKAGISVESKGYSTLCNGTTCTIPDHISSIGGM